MHLLKLVLFILLGFAIARIAGVNDLESTNWYVLVVATLSAVGLYANTYSEEWQGQSG